MNVPDLPDDSDSSDEDYVPEEKQEEIPSEVDSDGDPEEPPSDSEDVGKRKGEKRKKKTTGKTKKRSKSNKEEIVTNEQTNNQQSQPKEEDKKKLDDDLWADFMKDTGFKSKHSSANATTAKTSSSNSLDNKKNEPTTSNNITQKPVEKVKITQIFEFAGEEVKVEKEVDSNSAEGRLLSTSDSAKTSTGRKTGLGGISSVLSQLGKKQKISTLEKTKLDWDRFKKEENIDEELQTYNKGKDGYLERQDFLQRADLRRFEIEKDIRNVERSKRFNSAL